MHNDKVGFYYIDHSCDRNYLVDIKTEIFTYIFYRNSQAVSFH